MAHAIAKPPYILLAHPLTYPGLIGFRLAFEGQSWEPAVTQPLQLSQLPNAIHGPEIDSVPP